MSVKCPECGKICKTTQGLRGHKNFKHKMSRQTPSVTSIRKKIESRQHNSRPPHNEIEYRQNNSLPPTYNPNAVTYVPVKPDPLPTLLPIKPNHVEIKPRKKECVNCFEEIPFDVKDCPRCGRTADEFDFSEFRCFQCKKTIDYNDVICPHCGEDSGDPTSYYCPECFVEFGKKWTKYLGGKCPLCGKALILEP
jgi:DNA-directed RNA polymerase subunit RPC12/RpoP